MEKMSNNTEMTESYETETVTVPLDEETIGLSDEYKTESIVTNDNKPVIRHYTETSKNLTKNIKSNYKRPLKYMQHVIDEMSAEDDPTYKRLRK